MTRCRDRVPGIRPAADAAKGNGSPTETGRETERRVVARRDPSGSRAPVRFAAPIAAAAPLGAASILLAAAVARHGDVLFAALGDATIGTGTSARAPTPIRSSTFRLGILGHWDSRSGGGGFEMPEIIRGPAREPPDFSE